MGLSSSKKTTTSDQTTSGTTTPVAPPWVTNAAHNYVDDIGAYADSDPNQYVAPASPLQQQAWSNASENLGGWRDQAATASGLAYGAGTQGANLAGQQDPRTQAFAPPRVATGPNAEFARGGEHPGTGGEMQGPRPGLGSFLNGGSLFSGNAYNPAPEIPGYAQPRTGAPIGGATGVDSQSGTATALGQGYDAANVGTAQTSANALGSDYMSNYQNPYQDQVINTTLAGYDRDAAAQQAALAAQGANAGAFGGSRFGIAQGELTGQNSLGRAQTEAQLRSQGFDTAAGLGMQDANRVQSNNQFNANAGNQFALTQAGYNNDAARYGADASNTASQYNAGSINNMNQFNAGQQDNALNRQLAAAGLLGQQAQDIGAGTRADIGVMSDLGGDQRDIEQQYASAPLQQLLTQGALLGQIPYSSLVGQSVNGTSNGTNVEKSSPSLFSQLLQAGQAAAMFI